MKAKIFLMVAVYSCGMNAMDFPIARPVDPFDSSLSFKLPGMNSSVSIVQQQLANIVLVRNLYFKKKLDSQVLGINAVTCKPDGALFASAGNNLIEPTITIFSPNGSKHVSCKSNEEISTTCVTFSPDGTMLLCGSGKNVYFWDTQLWKLCRTLSLDTISDVNALAFSKSGQRIIIGGNAGKNNLTILTKKSDSSYVRELSGHKKGAISCVGFSPDGLRAISVCESKFKIWDIAKASLIYTDRGKSWSNCKVEYDQHNGWFLTGCDHLLGWWFSYDLNSGKKIIIPLQGQKLPRIKAYDRSGCGNYIFLGGAETSKIFVFNLRTKQYVYTIVANGRAISTIACSPDREFMVCAIKGSYESNLYLYRAMSDEDQKALQTVYSIAGDQLELVQRLIDEVAMKKTATLGDTDHVTFDRLPLLLKVLLQKYVVPKESMEEHDFTLLNCSELMPREPIQAEQSEDDEWTLID